MFDALGNIAIAYQMVGRHEESLNIRWDLYAGSLKFYGEEHGDTVHAANNYAASLLELERYAEVKALLRKTMPVARRVLGDSSDITLRIRWNYGKALYMDDGATLDDVREAVTTLEETTRISKRVLGGAHPLTARIESHLKCSRTMLQLMLRAVGECVNDTSK